MEKLIKQVNSLILKVGNGDKNALTKLYQLTGRMLLAMAKKYIIDKNYAEDMVSITFMKIVKHADTFDASKNGLNWIYKIVHNEALNFNRNSRHTYEMCVSDIDEYSKVTDMNDWLESLLLNEALSKLTEEERELLFSRYWMGYTLKEMSEASNRPLSSLNDKLKKLLDKLEKFL